MILRILFAVVSIFLFSLQAQAEEERYYRYKNNKGVTVINEFIPAEYAGKGYAIINKDGAVIKEIPRELNAAELREQQRQNKIKQQLAEEARKQEITDRLLLNTFASTDDIELTRDRVIKQLENKIETLTQNRIKEKRLLDKTYKDAANMERSVGKVSDALKTRIEAHKRKIEELGKLIESRSNNINDTNDEYQIKIDRYRLLTGMKPKTTEPENLPGTTKSNPD